MNATITIRVKWQVLFISSSARLLCLFSFSSMLRFVAVARCLQVSASICRPKLAFSNSPDKNKRNQTGNWNQNWNPKQKAICFAAARIAQQLLWKFLLSDSNFGWKLVLLVSFGKNCATIAKRLSLGCGFVVASAGALIVVLRADYCCLQ